MRRTKTLKFEINDPEEKMLYDNLQRLPHGEFSRITKQIWRERLLKEFKDSMFNNQKQVFAQSASLEQRDKVLIELMMRDGDKK